VAVRNVRRDGNDLLKRLEKAHEMSEDQVKGRSNDIQKITDMHVQMIDDALKHKAEEIMQV
jgi:ribosome recycling factor